MKLILVGVVFVYSNCACAQSDETSMVTDSMEVIDTLKASLTAASSMYPIDCIVRVTTSTEFPGEAARILPSSRYRLQVDTAKERACWMGSQQTSPQGQVVESIGGLTFFGCVVDGTSVNDFSRGSLPDRLNSFEEALTKSRIPLPHFWSVTRMSMFENPADEMMRIAALISEPNAVRRLTPSKSGDLSVFVRREENKKQFDIYRWHISLPEYTVQNFQIDRARDGTPLRYWEQDIVWIRHGELNIPIHITSETIVVRPGVNGLFDLGKQITDAEIAWISVGVSSANSENQPTPIFREGKDILEFLDQGEELAKKVGNFGK